MQVLSVLAHPRRASLTGAAFDRLNLGLAAGGHSVTAVDLTAEGFDPRLFEARAGLSVAVAEPALARAQERGLLERGLHNIRPSAAGRRFLNELLQLFLKD